MKTKLILMTLIVAVLTMGFDCVNDNAYFSINLQGITGTYNVPTGSTGFTNQCTQFNSSTYLDQSFATLGPVRIYDIRISTIGAYSGNISNGKVRVNGSEILSFSGSWSDFLTPQSLLTSTKFVKPTPNSGLAALVSAIQSQSTITLCGDITLSPAATSGLSVKIEVLGQVDAKP